MPTPALSISAASRDEVALLLEWAAREGWNPGLGDLDAFRAEDPDGFIVARLDGVPVAGISVVTYGNSFAFLGFYLCTPEHRGQGIGWATWQAGIAHAGARTIGLDGVVAQQANYSRSGFAFAHRNIRYGGAVAQPPSGQAGIVPVTPDLVPALIAFDAQRFGTPRAGFLSAWLDGSGGRMAQAHVANGRIAGYGVIRPCRDGHKIGPLFAETEAGAEALFRSLCGAVGSTTVYLDPPEPNRAAIALAERHGLAPVFETARMYRGTAPDLPLGGIYGITTFELG